MPNYMTELSPDNNTHVYQIKDKEASPIDLLKDTVGWVGKNKLPLGTIWHLNNMSDFNGLNTDGETTRARTTPAFEFPFPSQTFIISGLPSKVTELNANNGVRCFDANKNDLGKADINGFQFTTKANTAYIYIMVNGANFTVADFTSANVMIRPASIIDDTYEPYHKSVEEVVEQVYADNGVLGAKNLLRYPYWNTTKTESGITFTDNNDGTVTANGTATADAYFRFASSASNAPAYTLPSGDYILSGKGLVSGASIVCEAYNGTTYVKSLLTLTSGTPSGTLTIDNIGYDRLAIFLKVSNASTISNANVKPMLRLASDPDDTYVPYAMTNRELTELATAQESAITDIISGATVDTGASGNKLVKIGKIVFLRLSLKTVTATAYSDNLGVIPSGYRPTSNLFINAFGTNVKIGSNGNIQSAIALTSANVHIDTSWITS